MLKISENYTPEISNSIIAEVLNFEKEGGKTEVKILCKLCKGFDYIRIYFVLCILFVYSAGKEELLDPQGKFYMENDAHEEQDETEEKNEIFFWGNIVEPRLLFP